MSIWQRSVPLTTVRVVHDNTIADDDVRLADDRIVGFSQSVKEAHELHHGPGPIDEPWQRKFHEKAVQIYTMTIPWDYLVDLATRLCATAQYMTARGTQPEIAGDWIIVADYLRNASDAILAYAPEDLVAVATPGPIHSSTPSVMPYALLAELVSADGIARLETAGQAVSDRIGDGQSAPVPATAENPLDEDDAYLLRRIVAGDRVADISVDLGYSERSLYRQLNEIWERIGVSSRAEGIAKATARGWLGR